MSYNYPRYGIMPQSRAMRPIYRSDIVAIWAQVARIRERNGDKDGARRARQNARILKGVGKLGNVK